jgi:MFS family permease
MFALAVGSRLGSVDMTKLPRTAAFWLLAGALLALMFAAAAPSPLYVVYQADWGFSATTLTAVFAVYAVALLLALVTVGGLSDYVGRRPVIGTALAAEAVSMVMFATATGVGALFAARVLQGLATGAATGAISAALVDLQPPDNPGLGPLINSAGTPGGVALGALGTGLLVQFAPAPTTLVFVLLAGLFTVAAAGVLAMPEPVRRRRGALASLRPHVTVPRRIRSQFLVAVPALVAVWALGGLYLSLGPSLAAGLLDLHNRLVGGVVIFVLAGTGATVSVILRDRAPRRVMIVGSLLLAAGLAVTLAGVELSSVPVFFAGLVFAGAGFGSAFLGAFRTLAALAEPHERAGLFATIYVVSYLAFSLPAIAAGVAVTAVGLHTTVTVYGVVDIVLALAAVAGLIAQRRRPALTPAATR